MFVLCDVRGRVCPAFYGVFFTVNELFYVTFVSAGKTDFVLADGKTKQTVAV